MIIMCLSITIPFGIIWSILPTQYCQQFQLLEIWLNHAVLPIGLAKWLIFLLTFVMFWFQDDSQQAETRPGTAQAIGYYDPLDLDAEDLFVKYKVKVES